MVSAAFTLTIITVFGGLVYFGLERKLARAPPCLSAIKRPFGSERALTVAPTHWRAFRRRCS